MEIAELKREIKRMIEEPHDPDTPKQIFEREAAIRESMIESAIRAEEDIKAGRVYTSEEFWDYFKRHFKGYL